MRGRRVPGRTREIFWVLLSAIRGGRRPMSYDFLPIIKLRPGPTDAELEAERDAKHAKAVAAWEDDEDWPVGEVVG